MNGSFLWKESEKKNIRKRVDIESVGGGQLISD